MTPRMKRFVPLTLLVGLLLVSCPDSGCGFNNCRINLDFSAPDVVLKQGGSASIAITPRSDNGYSGSIEINISNVPDGVKYSLAPSTVMIGCSPASSVLTVNAAADAPTGNPVEVTINAFGKNNVGTNTKFKLMVKPKPVATPTPQPTPSPQPIPQPTPSPQPTPTPTPTPTPQPFVPPDPQPIPPDLPCPGSVSLEGALLPQYLCI